VQFTDLFPSASSRELGVRLAHLLELRGIGLATGEVGSGKTTSTRMVVTALHTGRHRVFYVQLTTGNVTDLFKSIAWEMGLATERSRAALHRRIRDESSRLCAERIHPVLIVDEAQHLHPDVLEDPRLLTNYEMDSQNPALPAPRRPGRAAPADLDVRPRGAQPAHRDAPPPHRPHP